MVFGGRWSISDLEYFINRWICQSELTPNGINSDWSPEIIKPMCTIQSLFSGGTYLACQAFLRWRLPNVFIRGPWLLVMSFVIRILKKTNSDLLKSGISTPPNESVFGSPLPLNWVLSNFWTLISFLPVYCTAHPPSTEKTWAELLTMHIRKKSSRRRWQSSDGKLSLVQTENSNHVTRIHTAMQQPRKPGSCTLRQNSESKTNRGLQTRDNIVRPPTGISLTSLMIFSSCPGIITLGVVMVLHNQHRLHLLKFKNYLSVLSLCQVMPKQAILVSSGKLPVSSV